LVKLKKVGRSFKRQVFNLYRRGANQIKIFYADEIMLKEIYMLVPSLIGFEISEQSNEYCILKSMVSYDETEFSNAFRRYFLITTSMADSIKQGFDSGNNDDFKSVIELESAQNRLFLFLCRLLTLYHNELSVYPSLMYTLVSYLEEIGDCLRDISILSIENDFSKIDMKTKKIFTDIINLTHNLYAFYYNKKISSGDEIITKCEKILEESYDLLKKKKNAETILVHRLIILCDYIYQATSPIFGIIL
jgi:hypothetical protein